MGIWEQIDQPRFQWAMRLLLEPILLAVVAEGDQWVAVSREIYLASQGSTKEQAVRSWQRCFVADLLTHAMTTARLPTPCPDATWQELSDRDGVRFVSMMLRPVTTEPC